MHLSLIFSLLLVAIAAGIASRLLYLSRPTLSGAAMAAALILGVTGFIVTMISPALAQTATVVVPNASASTLFNIPPLVWDELNKLIIGIAVGLALVIWKYLDANSPLKNTQAEQIARDAFTSLLCNGAKYGLTQLNAQEQKVGAIDVGNPAVAAAANYVIAQGPGMAAKLGFDVTTQDGQAAIIRMVTSRVGDLLTPTHEAPAPLPLPASVAAPSAPASKS